MNRYPWWKYLILGIALLVGLVYTLPNFFGEAPAVQVSSGKATLKLDAVNPPVVTLDVAGGADGIVSGQSGDAVIHGTGKPGLEVSITSGQTTLGSATPDANGQWTYTLSANNLTALGQGAGTLKATQDDGINPAISSELLTTIDTEAPVITSAASAQTISGTAPAGTEISIALDGVKADLSRLVKAATGDTWTYTLNDNAPHTDPMPPTITTTKLTMSICMPIPGATAVTGALIIPAKAASDTPRANTKR